MRCSSYSDLIDLSRGGLRPVWANQRILVYPAHSECLRFRQMSQAKPIKAVFWNLTGGRAEAGFKGQGLSVWIFYCSRTNYHKHTDLNNSDLTAHTCVSEESGRSWLSSLLRLKKAGITSLKWNCLQGWIRTWTLWKKIYFHGHSCFSFSFFLFIVLY